jgi:hypothetical protein
MANFTVSPAALTFTKVNVQGPVPGLYATPQTLSFVLTNNSGVSVTVTNYGFSTSTDGDAVTQPAGIYTNSDFRVAVHSGSYPVTIANGASQQFDVTYAPLRRGASFGDIRSAILTLFSGNKALLQSNPIDNSSGQPVNLSYAVPVTIGVGGGVLEEGYNYATAAPVYGDTGSLSRMSVSGTGEVNYGQGIPPNMTIADLDTGRHSVSAIELYSGTGAGTSVVGGVVVRARGVQVLVYGLDTASSIDLVISAVTTAGNVTVGSWVSGVPGTGALNYSNVGGLFIGNNEGIDLQGMNLFATVSNVTNPHTNTIAIGVVVTG